VLDSRPHLREGRLCAEMTEARDPLLVRRVDYETLRKGALLLVTNVSIILCSHPPASRRAGINIAETPLALQIIHYPHPTLRHVSKPLKRVDTELRAMVAEMFDLMYEHEGVGLAANQVDLPYRLFVANQEGDPAAKDAEMVFINPVLSAGRGQAEDEEGCLSIPGVRAPITRNSKIKVQAYDLAGNEIAFEADGLMARILQHETDHLDGTLFIDRLGPAQWTSLRDKLEEFELVFQSRRDTGEIGDSYTLAARIS